MALRMSENSLISATVSPETSTYPITHPPPNDYHD